MSVITDKPRIIVEQANTGVILYRDLEVVEPKFGKQLSGPGFLSFQLMPKANPLFPWSRNKQWVHVEMEIRGVRKIVLSTIVKSAVPDPETGVMTIECYGFSDYLKEKPWLVNINDIAVDPFEIAARIWTHVQNYSNAQLGVEVYPQFSGTQMLPGFGFDGSTLTFDFFALFIRAVDFVDCADQFNALARDIPFDFVEESFWDENRTEIFKRIHLSYPHGGVQHEYLSFVKGENVMKMELADEKDIEPKTDIIIRGWSPGKVYDSRLSTAESDRLRDVIMEEDAKINSNERGKALAGRKLARRNVPKYWKKIVIDPNHPNAPFGEWEVGDLVFVRGRDPWYGDIAAWHRIVSWAYDPKSGLCELGLKVEGAFNYDPIDYDPDYEDSRPPNKLKNGFFGENLFHWKRVSGTWIRNSTIGFETNGSVRVDIDPGTQAFRSERVSTFPGEENSCTAYVQWQGVTSTAGPGFILRIIFYNEGSQTGSLDIDWYNNPTDLHQWERLQGSFTTPSDSNEFAVQLVVSNTVTDGTAFWDDVVVPAPVQWEANHVYKEGDYVKFYDVNFRAYVGGTSGATMPDHSDLPGLGNYLVDGTVQWGQVSPTI